MKFLLNYITSYISRSTVHVQWIHKSSHTLPNLWKWDRNFLENLALTFGKERERGEREERGVWFPLKDLRFMISLDSVHIASALILSLETNTCRIRRIYNILQCIPNLGKWNVNFLALTFGKERERERRGVVST